MSDASASDEERIRSASSLSLVIAVSIDIQSRSSHRSRDAKAFAASAPSLPPNDAAAQWISLLNRFFDLQPRQDKLPYPSGEIITDVKEANVAPVAFQDVIAALPPPEAWAEIRTRILQRPFPPVPPGFDARAQKEWRKHLRERTLRLFGLPINQRRRRAVQ